MLSLDSPRVRMINSLCRIQAMTILSESVADLQKMYKVPTWFEKLDGIWWSAVAALYQQKRLTFKDKPNYGGITKIFKIYVKRFFGIDVDKIKGDGSAGAAMKLIKRQIATGMKNGDKDAAAIMSRLSHMNKAFEAILKANDGSEDAFVKAIRTQIHAKYLSKK